MELDTIKTIEKAYTEAKSSWIDFFSQCKEDWRFKMTDQWSDEDKAVCRDKGLPMLSINHIFKNINLISGYQRQNRAEIKVFPIEGSDESKAEVLNMVIKWLMVDKNMNFKISDACKDSLIGGISWLHPYLVYDDDPLNGDIVVKKISPFNILPDPHFTERDLSDCDYIIRHQRVTKNKLKMIYPKYAEKIKDMTGSPQTNEFLEEAIVPTDQGNHLLVIEYWYRVWDKVTMVMSIDDPENMRVWDPSEGDVDAWLQANPDWAKIENVTKPRIKLAVSIEHTLLVRDDYSPYGGNMYPFIPMFCFYESSYSDWKLKLHGLVRPLKDLQREKNKRRSQIMQAINTMPHSGWIGDKNAVDDPAVLLQAAGAGRVIWKNPNKVLEPIRPPDIPASLIQMETMFDNDIQVVGNNPDLLGQVSDRGAPGIVLQLRQRQGITSIQEVFDSWSEAQRELGRRLINMIVTNFSVAKIKRIVGDDFTYTKQIKELNGQMNALKSQVPVVPEIPMEVNPQDETVYQMSSPGAKAILEEQKMQEREVQQEYAVQKQMYAVRQQAMLIQHEIQRLQGEERAFWQEFEEVKNTARFDVAVDETISSATYRASVLTMLTQMQQYGMPVPPEMILDYMELAKSQKDRYMQYMKSQQALQQQMMMAQAMAGGKPKGATVQ